MRNGRRSSANHWRARTTFGARWLLFLVVGLALVTDLRVIAATDQEPVNARSDDKAADVRRSDHEMAERIDRIIEQALQSQGIACGEVASDAEFLRRLSLDLLGVIPTVSQVRAFLADERPAKRTLWIDELIDSPRFATHRAITWRRAMLPTTSDARQAERGVELQAWLREQFANNLRYDRLVAEFLSVSGDDARGPAVFYESLETKPEKLAAATSRLFLGLQIQCAECHDHPFDHWKQEDFWAYAAFFAQIQSQGTMRTGSLRLVDLKEGDVRIPGSDTIVSPRFPVPEMMTVSTNGTRRKQLSIWMASRDNPFLAQAVVNRVWEQLLGRGLVHPVDDMSTKNTARYPQVLQELSDHLIAQQFDLRSTYRVIANTRLYQRTSQRDDDRSAGDPFDGSRMVSKRMTPEQLYDSWQRAIHRVTEGVASSPIGDVERQQFLQAMESTSVDRTEYDWGLQQTLRLMNGQQWNAVGQPDQGLLAALQAPWMNDRDRVEIVFLTTLSRMPRDDEYARCQAFLDEHEASRDHAWRDLVWVLVNSAEFQLIP